MCPSISCDTTFRTSLRPSTRCLVVLAVRWAVCHVNAAKRIPSLVEKTTYLSVFGEHRELVPTPWLGTEVKATRGPHTGCVGRVELVERVNGRFGRKIMVGFWVELLCRLVFTDHDHLLTTG